MNQTKTLEHRYLSIRWKTVFRFTVFFTAIFASVFYWFYRISINITLDDLYQDLTAISNTAASGLDGDIHQALYEDANYDVSLAWPKGMKDERYWEMAEWLYLVHQSNPKAFLYTYVSPEPGKVEFVVSMGALMNPIIGAEFLEPYWPQAPSVILDGLEEVTLSKKVVTDQWGSWISGFTPLYNSKNEIVAAVGVDYRADNIPEIKSKITKAAIPAFVIAYLFLLAFLIYLSNRTVNPVISLSKAATQIGEGKLVKVNHSTDFFRDEISSLTDTFNIMVENIQKHRKHTISLYQDNIQRHERERMKLAHNLHDEVLNGLAALSMAIDDQHVGPQFQRDYEKLSFRIRKIISGLRPPMLNHGLYPALESLVDEIIDRHLSKANVVFEIEESTERYESSVEGHIYRIAQQACDNAIQHANAKTIRISGSLGKDHIQIIVADDGVGFNPEDELSRSPNSNYRHYGLIGMQERAEIINAELRINSTPGEGTHIKLILSDVLQKLWEFRARIQAEAALRESEITARGLMNATLDVIYLIDRDGIILDANNALANEFNKKIDELVGARIWDLWPSAVAEQRMHYLDRVFLSGKPLRFEEESDGRWFENYLYPITEEFGKIPKVAIFSRELTMKKLLEESLKESVEESKSIINATPDIAFLINREGLILNANEALSKQFEKPQQELIGNKIWDLLPDEIVQTRKPYFDQVQRTGKPARFEDFHGEVCFDAIVYPILDDEGSVAKIAVFARDITDRKHAEQALKFNEENFRAIAENAHDAIFVADMSEKFLYVNRQAEIITGFDVRELHQLRLDDIIHPEDLGVVQARFRARMEGQSIGPFHKNRVVRKDGTLRHVELTATLLSWKGSKAILAIVRDITERKLTEQTLRISEENFRAIAENAHDAIFVIDSSEQFVYVNQSAGKITGYKTNELQKMGIQDIVHSEDLKIGRSRFHSRLQGGIINPYYQGHIIRKDGKIIKAELSATRLNWGGNAAILTIVRERTTQS